MTSGTCKTRFILFILQQIRLWNCFSLIRLLCLYIIYFGSFLLYILALNKKFRKIFFYNDSPYLHRLYSVDRFCIFLGMRPYFQANLKHSCLLFRVFVLSCLEKKDQFPIAVSDK